MNVDWIIFYDDGTEHTSDNGAREAPRVGVEVIAQKNEKTGYGLFFTDGDYFVYDKDRGGWRITDQFGMFDHLITCREPLVLFGRNMSDDAFMEMKRKVAERCGPKSAWLRRERRR